MVSETPMKSSRARGTLTKEPNAKRPCTDVWSKAAGHDGEEPKEPDVASPKAVAKAKATSKGKRKEQLGGTEGDEKVREERKKKCSSRRGPMT